MKKEIILTLSVICFIGLSAQEDSISLRELETPTSPAFILLDKTPTSIERPSSTKAFTFSVLNSIADNKGLPQNYAVEFSPFWFFKHPKMTALKYMGYDAAKNKQRIFGNMQRFSFSMATLTSTDSLSKSPVNNFSMGLRINFVSIRSSKDIQDLRAANDSMVYRLRDVNKRLKQQVDIALKITDPVLYREKVKEFYAQEAVLSKEEKNSISDILKRRAVFAIDGALGYNNFFLDNNYSSSHFGRMGAWLTMNYSQNLGNAKGKNYLNFYALGRYLSDGTTRELDKYVVRNFTDFGGKLEFEFNKVSFSYEYIRRIAPNVNTFRSSGMLKYKITNQVYLTAAFGKNFGSQNNLISLVGLNWGAVTGNEKGKIVKE
jgi:hypothetical protein